MFFPAIESKDPLKDEKQAFKNLPTIIICNHNAAFYQHMLNHPNSFLLNLFHDLGINVMAWNYRSYGLTKGTPSPFNLKCDAEQILNFVQNKLRV